MWSDELHRKMEEAEQHGNSSNPEQAWEKMELLLDDHLPVKKKRRRFIFLLFPLLLGSGIALFLLQKKTGNDQPIPREKNSAIQQPVDPPGNNTMAVKPADKTTTREVTNTTEVTETLNQPTLISENPADQQKELESNNDFVKKQEGSRKTLKTFYRPTPQYSQPKNESGKKVLAKNQRQPGIDLNNSPDKSISEPAATNENNSTGDIKNITTQLLPGDTAITKASASDSSKTNPTVDSAIAMTKKTPKKKSSFNNNLSFGFSAGPDISSVGIDRPGKLALPYGVGISYEVSKKISIRTGFFVGKKIYAADSADYNPPANFWNYYPNLQKIDANCLVYEIPLSFVYNFSSAKNHNWFMSAGLSSYLMKKEAYEYYYKNSWGQQQQYHRTYKNENSHLFSVLNLSGGYRYHVSDKVSIMGEPYIKIPVSGVGYGKVKLNSAGLLFTVNVAPFAKKN